MATNITLALDILNSFNWWWSLGDDYAYTNGTRERMEKKMKRFVELASTCSKEVCEALRELWIAKYTLAHKDWMFSRSTEADKVEFETKKAKLMEIINPSMALAA